MGSCVEHAFWVDFAADDFAVFLVKLEVRSD